MQCLTLKIIKSSQQTHNRIDTKIFISTNCRLLSPTQTIYQPINYQTQLSLSLLSCLWPAPPIPTISTQQTSPRHRKQTAPHNFLRAFSQSFSFDSDHANANPVFVQPMSKHSYVRFLTESRWIIRFLWVICAWKLLLITRNRSRWGIFSPGLRNSGGRFDGRAKSQADAGRGSSGVLSDGLGRLPQVTGWTAMGSRADGGKWGTKLDERMVVGLINLIRRASLGAKVAFGVRCVKH